MKKEFTLAALLLIFSLNVFSQAPNWSWAKSAGGTNFDFGASVATDAVGNVYVTGVFYSASISFGAYTLINTNAGIEDMFIVKYDPSGTVLWAKSAGGTGEDRGLCVSTDTVGNVYLTGYFVSHSIIFGSDTLINTNPIPYNDMFIVKYDASGAVVWAKSPGGFINDYGVSVSTDAGGNAYVTGSFDALSIVFGTDTLTKAGDYDMFIVKYDTSGMVLWAKSAGGTDSDDGISVSTDAVGNAYVTGHFYSSSIIFGTDTLINTGLGDLFIVKYDASGTVLWAKSAGGTNFDFGVSVATDAVGNVYVEGYFNSPSIIFGTDTLTNAGGVGTRDIFIVKYDVSGIVLWAKSAGGTNYDEGYSASTDAGGNVYMSGYFDSPSIIFGTYTLTNTGADEMFIVKCDSSGTVLWAKSAEGTSNDGGRSVSTDAFGNVYVTGYFNSSSIAFGAIGLTNAGSLDMFIAKLDTTVLTASSEIEKYDNSILLFPNPAGEQFTVYNEQFTIAEIETYNLIGEKVFEKKFTAQNKLEKIDVSELPPGIYFVNVIGKEFSVARKFVKQ